MNWMIDSFSDQMDKKVLEKDMLFATLDTTIRKITPGNGRPPLLLSDTVGFINKLPHSLIKAFHSTLEEAGGAHGGGNYVQIPNSLFFQRALRRWRPGSEPQAAPAPAADSSSTPAAASAGGGSAAPVAANDP